MLDYTARMPTPRHAGRFSFWEIFAMEMRKLGRTELVTAPLMLGGNVFGWTLDAKGSFDILDRFVAGGGNAIDTADVYTAWIDGNEGGESETIIGDWLKRRGRRDDVLIATKVAKWAKHPGLSAANIEAAVEDSLRRLQTDYIDLYQSHEDDAATPLEETLAAYDRLIEAGKVRAIGASNYECDRLDEALKTSADKGLARYEVLQPEYNLVERKGFELALRPLVEENEVGVITYFSLASGFLSGKYRSEKDAEGKARGSGVTKYITPAGLGVLEVLDAVAEAHSATPAQVAIAWVVQRPGVTAAIASATKPEQLDDLLKAAQLKLSADEMGKLDEASASF